MNSRNSRCSPVSNQPCCTKDGCLWDGLGWHCRGNAYGGCGRTFATSSAFDMHMRDDRCRNPASIKTKDGRPRLILNARGHWGYPAPAGGRPWIPAIGKTQDAPFGGDPVLEDRSGESDGTTEG